MLPAVHLFGGHRLDPGRRSLTTLDGTAVKLTGKGFDALVYLVEHSGEVVDRATLVQVLWPKRIVEENNLNQAIAAIRRAIGEEHIATVAGRGYQFVTPSVRIEVEKPEVSLMAPNDATRSSSAEPSHAPRVGRRSLRSFVAASAAAALVIAAVVVWSFGVHRPVQRPDTRPSIAVLPLENLSPDPDKAYVAWHLHEAIIGRLFDFGFDVRPRGAVRQYAPSMRPSLAEIAQALDVDSVMEGTVRYADDRLRVSLTLVATADGKPLWHDEFDREYADLFAIESEVARNVADALEATLTPQQLVGAEQGFTTNPAAYDLYVTGMDHERRSIFNRDFVIAQYERATQIDSEFSLAWTRLAFAKLTKRRWLSTDPELLSGARVAAERALEITPDLALARITLVYLRYLEDADRRELLRELNALEGKSQRIPEFFAIRASIYSDLGLLEEQLADRNQVVVLEPRHVPYLLANGESSMTLRRYDEAQALFDRARQLEPNDTGGLLHSSGLPLFRDGDPRVLRELEPRVLSEDLPPAVNVAWAAIYDADYDAAVRILSLLPDTPTGFQRPVMLAQALELAGRHSEAQALFVTALERIQAQIATAPPARRPALEIWLGAVKVGLGEPAAAVEHVNAGLRNLHLVRPLNALGLRVDAILVLASAGAVEPTLAELESYLSGPGNWSLEGLLPHPAFDRIRDDARVVAVVTKNRASSARLAEPARR
jgi:DNA-binding winged helix-turn-helix (wHTH) protein/TolB-like protein/tetratricopeptide (TPR) repeat protein